MKPQALFALLSGALLCAPLAPAPAQDARALPAGSRVRWMFVGGERKWYVGTVLEAHTNTVVAQRTDSGQSVKLINGDLQELDVSLGAASRGRGARKGAFIGLIGGLSAAAVAGLATGCLHGPPDPFFGPSVGSNNANCIGAGAAAGIVLAGVALGAVIGAAGRPGEAWVKVPLGQIQARVSRDQLGLAIAF
jgi:hypothetical protein